VWAGYSADVFLSNLEECEEATQGILAVELKNLSRAVTRAEAACDTSVAREAPAMFDWARTAAFGSPLS
jgi:hypothetical protein